MSFKLTANHRMHLINFIQTPHVLHKMALKALENVEKFTSIKIIILLIKKYLRKFIRIIIKMWKVGCWLCCKRIQQRRENFLIKLKKHKIVFLLLSKLMLKWQENY